MAKAHFFLVTDDSLPAKYATVYKQGVVVNGAQSAVSSVTVHANHGISNGNKMLYALTRSNVIHGTVYTASGVAGASDTSIGISPSVTVPDKSLFVNLEADTGGGQQSDGSYLPMEFDGSSVTAYKDPNGDATHTNATVEIEPGGEFGFYADPGTYWIVLRDTHNRVVRVYVDVGPLPTSTLIGPGSSVDEAIARFDGATGTVLQDYRSGAPTVSDIGAMTIPLTLNVNGVVTAEAANVFGAKTINNVRYASGYATAGSGTTAFPWTGWETAFDSIPTTGCSIVFPAGVYSKTAEIALPVNLTGWLRIYGEGGATIKLTAAMPRCFRIASHSDYDTAKFYDIRHLTIDCDSQDVTADNSGILIGTTLTTRNYLNWSNIRISDVTILNATDANGSTGISMTTQHATADEATQTTASDITIENVRQEGGNNGIVMTAGSTAGGNCNNILSRLIVRNHYHVRLDVPLAYAAGANIQLGQNGLVYDSIIENCYWENSVDVGIEVDAPVNVIVRNCTCVDAYETAFYATNFNTTVDQDRNTITFENCTAKVVNATSTLYYELTGFKVQGSETLEFGNAVIRDCSFESNDTVEHLPFVTYRAPQTFIVDGFRSVQESVVNLAGTRALMPVRSADANRIVRLHNIRTKIAVDAGALAGTFIATAVDLASGYVDIDGFFVDWTYTNNAHATGVGTRLVEIASGLAYGISTVATQEIQGCIRNVVVQSWSGDPTDKSILYGVKMSPTYLIGSNGITVADCDFSNFPDGARHIQL